MILAASCQEDIDLDVQNTTGILCVNGFLYSDCDSNVLYISKTGISSPKNVLNASVKMYVNGVLAEEKSMSDNQLSNQYSLKTKFQPGDLVRIEVDCDGQHVWSESTAPQTPKDFDAKVTLERGKTYYDIDWEEFKTEDMYRLDVTFSDISADKNYYRLYTNKDAYQLRKRKEWMEIYDSTYDAEYGEYFYFASGDTTIILSDTARAYNSELYIRETPELADEEMTANNQLLDMSTYNYYKIFTNSRFAGGKCNMKVYERVNYGGYYYDDNAYKAPPETQVIYEDDIDILPEYNYTEYVGIEVIDEDTYYYVKSLNGFESGNFDEQELTGAVKMRRNVNGGSGNISIVSRVMKTIVVYDHYKPTPILKPRENNDDDNNYYYDEDDYRYYDE